MSTKYVYLLPLCLSLVAGAAVEKREMPGNPAYAQGYGGLGGAYGPQEYSTAMAPFGGVAAPPQQPNPFGPPPNYGLQGFPDPGFSIQTGFEGYLVPNSWYGLMPWGAEGVVVVVTGVIVFIVIAVVILGLLAWLCGFGDYAIVKEAARSFMPSNFTIDFETLADITTAVFDALDKYNELSEQKKDN